MSKEVFKATAQTLGKCKVSCSSREFKFILDEPKQLGGTNEGMNPIEALLSSLGACMVIVAKSFASTKNIQLNDIRIELEGELDLDGFLGRNKEAKIGLSRITSKFFISADNTEEEIQ